MKTVSKAEKLRQKMASLEEQLKAAERAEREQKKEAEKRERRRRERAVVAAAGAAGLFSVSLSREALEAEFREIAKRLEDARETAVGPEDEAEYHHQEDRNGLQNYSQA